MTETVGHRKDGVGGEARAVLVGAGEPRHMEELGRSAGGAGRGGGGAWGEGRRAGGGVAGGAGPLGMEGVGVWERGRRDNAGYLGRGKREELGGLVEEVGAGFVVTDDELTACPARGRERGARAGRA